MPMSERRPSTMNSFVPVEPPQNSMAGQQRLQISELQFDKFHIPSSFLYWKIRFRTQVSSCSDFPFGRSCVTDQRSRDGRFSG